MQVARSLPLAAADGAVDMPADGRGRPRTCPRTAADGRGRAVDMPADGRGHCPGLALDRALDMSGASLGQGLGHCLGLALDRALDIVRG